MARISRLVLVTAVVLAAAAPADAAKFVVHGRGFGHGVGLSQYGAYGYAEHGRDYKEILGHYFTGTRVGSAGSKTVRVLIGGGGNVAFSGAERACG